MFEKYKLMLNFKKQKIKGVKLKKDGQEIELIKCPQNYKGKFEIPDGVTSIGCHAFEDCENLTGIKIPNSVTSIGKSAFYNCKNLTSITIPNSVTSIEMEVFGFCKNLTNITIPDSVISIGHYAFCDCKNLTYVKIPDSVINIARDAFDSHVLLNIKIGKIPRKEVYYGLYKLFSNKLYKLADVDCNFVKNTVMKNPSLSHINIEIGEEDYFTLMYNLGLFAKKGTMIEKADHSKEPIQNVGYAILRKLFVGDSKQPQHLELKDVHTYFQSMQPTDEVNEEFIKFLSIKTNMEDIIQQEKKQPGFISRTLDWFESRKILSEMSNEQELNTSSIPTCEANRYRLRVYEKSDSGIDKIKWKAPTVEYLLKEFAENKFINVTEETRHIADFLGQFDLYEQKHFDKAVEIDNERKSKGIPEHILEEPLKQDKFKSYAEYEEKVKHLKQESLQEASKTLSESADVADKIFSYEMLGRSDVANFAMGFFTSCCATLYGAGAGAMRAMITDERMQPLVVRDSNDKIVCFGIVYVNKQEGYAVVNDFEVNRDYMGKDEQRKLIYDKAMQGIDAFATNYNEKNPNNPLKKVTCGISTNWDGINSFVEKNPKSSILQAPDFKDYKYAGSRSWPGDWHGEQYTIWEPKTQSREK